MAIDPVQHTSHVTLLTGPSPRTKRIMAAKIPDLHSASSTVVLPSHVLFMCYSQNLQTAVCLSMIWLWRPVTPRHAPICWVWMFYDHRHIFLKAMSTMPSFSLSCLQVDSTGRNGDRDLLGGVTLEVQCWCGILGVVPIGSASMDRLWQDLGD
uniref:Uncharacterized protein n=1 Tax=Oryza barthii TaxID=65489 RepID=A0A0D3HSW3_9ORYZ